MLWRSILWCGLLAVFSPTPSLPSPSLFLPPSLPPSLSPSLHPSLPPSPPPSREVDHVCAKQFSLREGGLRQVRAWLEGAEGQSRREVSTAVRATCQVLERTLRDKVLSVRTELLFSLSLHLRINPFYPPLMGPIFSLFCHLPLFPPPRTGLLLLAFFISPSLLCFSFDRPLWEP